MALGNLILRDPFTGFGPLLERAFPPASDVAASAFVPRIDAVEEEGAFRVTAELPGVAEEDVAVEVEDGVLTLRGEKKSHFEAPETDGARYRRVETSWGRFERRLRFGGPIDESNVRASAKNGVLTIVIPKLEEPRPAVRTIPIERA